MPRCYVVKYDFGGPGEIGIYAVYDDKTNYYSTNFNQPIDVANPIKNQISKAAVADFLNTNLLIPNGVEPLSAGDVELVS